MSTLEATVSMLETLPEEEINAIYEVTKRFFINRTGNNPFQPKTEDEIIQELDIARGDAEAGMVTDAKEVSSELREKYGL